jgi:putative transposase
MQTVGSRYVRYFNRTHDRMGPLWNGRYRCFLIDTEQYWLNCLRYVEQNPVRAGLVKSPEEYPWSSYASHARGSGPEWLVPHSVYEALGRSPETRQSAYRALCGELLTDADAVLIENGLAATIGVSEISSSSPGATSDDPSSAIEATSETSPSAVQ